MNILAVGFQNRDLQDFQNSEFRGRARRPRPYDMFIWVFLRLSVKHFTHPSLIPINLQYRRRCGKIKESEIQDIIIRTYANYTAGFLLGCFFRVCNPAVNAHYVEIYERMRKP